MTNLDSFPRLALGHFPTPVEEMSRLREALGPNAPRLLIKHDDYSGPGFGGNKVRKLEYGLAKALAEGADSVITTGGVRSNHCRVTAALAARVGLKCHLVLNGQAAGVPASFFLDELYGARIHRVSSRTDRDPEVQRVAGELRSAGRVPFVIPLGASDPLGSLGYVRAAIEVARQCEAPTAIYVSSSSGGTQAGLEAGLQLFGLERTRLIGVSPDVSSAEGCRGVAEIVSGIEAMLEVAPGSLGRELTMDDRFVGPGYGIPTEQSDEATRLLARTEGVVLDPVYTGKAMAAMLHDIREGRFKKDETVLFWHTGGQLALFTSSAGVE